MIDYSREYFQTWNKTDLNLMIYSVFLFIEVIYHLADSEQPEHRQRMYI